MVLASTLQISTALPPTRALTFRAIPCSAASLLPIPRFRSATEMSVLSTTAVLPTEREYLILTFVHRPPLASLTIVLTREDSHSANLKQSTSEDRAVMATHAPLVISVLHWGCVPALQLPAQRPTSAKFLFLALEVSALQSTKLTELPARPVICVLQIIAMDWEFVSKDRLSSFARHSASVTTWESAILPLVFALIRKKQMARRAMTVTHVLKQTLARLERAQARIPSTVSHWTNVTMWESAILILVFAMTPFFPISRLAPTETCATLSRSV